MGETVWAMRQDRDGAIRSRDGGTEVAVTGPRRYHGLLGGRRASSALPQAWRCRRCGPLGSSAGADLTIFYNGTQLTGTSGSVTRVLKRLPRFSPFTLKPDGTLVGGHGRDRRAG